MTFTLGEIRLNSRGFSKILGLLDCLFLFAGGFGDSVGQRGPVGFFGKEVSYRAWALPYPRGSFVSVEHDCLQVL